ncbi:mycothiol S-conjugate amidase [Jatrophihabitans sp. GAS493]|uniref:mycothiol conjugate amidase Mca n=1 Tax=Jatrophihabitans sp. GAS493 TaxID=1907575 RepID=UPI000BB896CE|nr:mycothiol S-conjugate amidase [Jatrophihabitans sp. GAS493]
MAVHAHPDDESSKGAATMARYVDEGVEVLVVTCTGGERGSILNPALQGRADIEANIAEIRKGEMDRARAILGVEQSWLGFVDSGLPEGDPLPPLPEGCFGLMDVDTAAEALVAQIRAFRPQVITTYDENGGYPHPDHIMCHNISMRAFAAAGDPDAYPDAGQPWQPSKLYYDVGFSMERMQALHDAMTSKGLESPFEEIRSRWSERSEKRRVPNITTRIACGDWFERRDAALLAHATQVDPNGWFFKAPLDIQRSAWGTEDFELAQALVATSLPEDDLFAGVRAPAADGTDVPASSNGHSADEMSSR